MFGGIYVCKRIVLSPRGGTQDVADDVIVWDLLFCRGSPQRSNGVCRMCHISGAPCIDYMSSADIFHHSIIGQSSDMSHEGELTLQWPPEVVSNCFVSAPRLAAVSNQVFGPSLLEFPVRPEDSREHREAGNVQDRSLSDSLAPTHSSPQSTVLVTLIWNIRRRLSMDPLRKQKRANYMLCAPGLPHSVSQQGRLDV